MPSRTQRSAICSFAASQQTTPHARTGKHREHHRFTAPRKRARLTRRDSAIDIFSSRCLTVALVYRCSRGITLQHSRNAPRYRQQPLCASSRAIGMAFLRLVCLITLPAATRAARAYLPTFAQVRGCLDRPAQPHYDVPRAHHFSTVGPACGSFCETRVCMPRLQFATFCCTFTVYNEHDRCKPFLFGACHHLPFTDII